MRHFVVFSIGHCYNKCREEGKQLTFITLVCKKIAKNCYSIPQIADMLEEDEETIQKIYDVALKYTPEFDAEKILNELNNLTT